VSNIHHSICIGSISEVWKGLPVQGEGGVLMIARCFWAVGESGCLSDSDLSQIRYVNRSFNPAGIIRDLCTISSSLLWTSALQRCLRERLVRLIFRGRKHLGCLNVDWAFLVRGSTIYIVLSSFCAYLVSSLKYFKAERRRMRMATSIVWLSG